MTQYSSLEEYAAHVGAVSESVLNAISDRYGPTHPAMLALKALYDEAVNIAQQSQKQPVPADTPSNSETPFENE